MNELIRREDAIKVTWKEPSYVDPYNILTEVRDRINEIPAASTWHRVEDEMPKYGQDVLAARLYGADVDGWAYEIIIAHVCEARGTNYWNATNITHWMPLPEPPKEDA